MMGCVLYTYTHTRTRTCIHKCMHTCMHTAYIKSRHVTLCYVTSHHITSHSIHTLMHAHKKRYSNAKSGRFRICFWSLSLLQGNICITSQRMLERNYAPDSPRKYLDDALTTLDQYGHAPLLPFLCKTTKT